MPVQALAALEAEGLLQTLKVCGTAPEFLTVKTTVPTGAVSFESLNENSVGLPAVTEIFVGAAFAVPFAAEVAATPTTSAAATAPMRAMSATDRITCERDMNGTSLGDPTGGRSTSSVAVLGGEHHTKSLPKILVDPFYGTTPSLDPARPGARPGRGGFSGGLDPRRRASL